MYRAFDKRRRMLCDTICLANEAVSEGGPLLSPAMIEGWRVGVPRSIEENRDYVRQQLAKLPDSLRSLDPQRDAYPVHVSPSLTRLAAEMDAAQFRQVSRPTDTSHAPTTRTPPELDAELALKGNER